jgi:hypothetical protein
MQTLFLKSARERKRTSQFVGVNFDKFYKKFKASISIQGRKKILGYFDSELEAARCWNEVAATHGRPLNFIEE